MHRATAVSASAPESWRRFCALSRFYVRSHRARHDGRSIHARAEKFGIPVARVDTVETRLKAMADAIKSVRPDLSNFYASLGDRKIRFDRELGSLLDQQCLAPAWRR